MLMNAGAIAGAVHAMEPQLTDHDAPHVSMTELSKRDVWLASKHRPLPPYRVIALSTLGPASDQFAEERCVLASLLGGTFFSYTPAAATAIALFTDPSGATRFVEIVCHWPRDAKDANKRIQQKMLRTFDAAVLLFDASSVDSFSLAKAVAAKGMERAAACKHPMRWVLAPALGTATDAHAQYAATAGCSFVQAGSIATREGATAVFFDAVFPLPEKPPLTLASEQRCCIEILRGRGLVAKDVTGDSDPYVRIWATREDGALKAFKGQKYKTPVVYKSLDPEWNYTVYYNTAGAVQEGFTGLAFEVWDEDMISADDFMGLVVVPWEMLEQHAAAGAEAWFPVTPSVKKAKARVSGDLCLRFHFPYIAGPDWKPPLRHVRPPH